VARISFAVRSEGNRNSPLARRVIGAIAGGFAYSACPMVATRRENKAETLVFLSAASFLASLIKADSALRVSLVMLMEALSTYKIEDMLRIIWNTVKNIISSF
jgi:hypothetical protein